MDSEAASPRGVPAPLVRGAGVRASVATDAELATRARSGDREAFGRIYERYAALVHGILLAHAPQREAGDLLQDVFVLALRSIATLEDPNRLGPWLSTITRNRARDHLKRGNREVELEREPLPGPALDQASDEAEEARVVLEHIRSLPESYRETLALRLVEGLSGPEIAARTGLTHGSVRVNLFRGMQALRERLERATRRRTS